MGFWNLFEPPARPARQTIANLGKLEITPLLSCSSLHGLPFQNISLALRVNRSKLALILFVSVVNVSL